jgi:hypothetical protein
MRYATGKYAQGVCDVCGQAFSLSALRPLVVQGVKTGIMACPADWNEDHPQNMMGRFKVRADAEALRTPRPELDHGREPVPDWESALTQITRNLP